MSQLALTQRAALTAAVGPGDICDGVDQKTGVGEAALAACTSCQMPKVASGASVVETRCLKSPAELFQAVGSLPS